MWRFRSVNGRSTDQLITWAWADVLRHSHHGVSPCRMACQCRFLIRAHARGFNRFVGQDLSPCILPTCVGSIKCEMQCGSGDGLTCMHTISFIPPCSASSINEPLVTDTGCRWTDRARRSSGGKESVGRMNRSIVLWQQMLTHVFKL